MKTVLKQVGIACLILIFGFSLLMLAIGAWPMLVEKFQERWSELHPDANDISGCMLQQDTLTALRVSRIDKELLVYYTFDLPADAHARELSFKKITTVILTCTAKSSDWTSAHLIYVFIQPVQTLDDNKTHYVGMLMYDIAGSRKQFQVILDSNDPAASLQEAIGTGTVGYTDLMAFSVVADPSMLTNGPLAVKRLIASQK